MKAEIEKCYKSGVVYQIICPCCKACYVGQTNRHTLQRIKEHQRASSPVGRHLEACNTTITMDDVIILAQTNKSEDYLMTLEALFINDLKPTLNKKDEYKSNNQSLIILFPRLDLINCWFAVTQRYILEVGGSVGRKNILFW